MDSMLNVTWINFLIVVTWLSISTTSSDDSTDRNVRGTLVNTRMSMIRDMVAKPSASIKTSVLKRRRHGSPNIQHSRNKIDTIPCPKGYKVHHYGGRVHCSPWMYPVPTGSKMLDCLATPGCGFSKHPTFRRNGCPYGPNKVISMGRIICANQLPKQFETSRVYDNEIPYKRQRIVETNHKVPIDSPECDDGKVAAMTENGYVCVDPVFPASVCPDDRVPAWSRDGIQCIPCPFGTTITRTSGGVKCESVEASRSDHCPDGLQPLNTAAGMVCQYVPVVTHDQRVPKEPEDSRTDHPNPCKTGEILIVSKTGSVCHAPVSRDDIEHSSDVGVRVCEYGYVLVQSTLSFTCVRGSIPEFVFPMCGPNFVFAKLHHEYKCITQVDARVVCQAHQILSQAFDGFHCIETEHSSGANQYANQNVPGSQCGQYQQYDTYLRKCVSNHGYVANNEFNCPRGQTFNKLTRSCIPGYRCFAGQTFSRLTGACVSDTFCPPGQTFNQQAKTCVSKSYCPPGQTFSEHIGGCVSCRPGLVFNTKTRTCMAISQLQVKEQILCNHGQVFHTDEYGKQQCISMDAATDLCGIGYIAVGDNDGFVCKMERQDVMCPRGSTLTTSNGQPLCFKGGCSKLSMLHPRTDSTSGGCYQLPVCEENYSMNHDGNGPYCVLYVSQTSTGKGVTPCDRNASAGGCDIPADKLLQGCNPDCANGGTCVNDTCICPPGITGSGCHLDVDECQNHPCDYRCINTFGSFQCTCPTGMALAMDGIACKVTGCVKPCLNNGTCSNGHCVCSSGFEGENCEKDKDECALHGRHLCQYKCRNSYGGYQCICPPGSRLNRDGRTCRNTTCHPECRNGGVCRNHKCQCPSGLFGIICQFDVNECRSHKIPCDQICNNTWGSYHCSCREGYTLQPDNKTCK